jgi:hypothetical protein
MTAKTGGGLRGMLRKQAEIDLKPLLGCEFDNFAMNQPRKIEWRFLNDCVFLRLEFEIVKR